MKTFGASLEDADDKFKSLERSMSQFNKDMDTIRARTADFGQSWKDMSKVDAFKDANQSINDFNDNLQQAQRAQNETNPMQMGQNQAAGMRDNTTVNQTTPSPMERTAAENVSKVEIGTIRIDVSGVTDRTDKERLAQEISRQVTKELKSKMGGPLSGGGYNRGV